MLVRPAQPVKHGDYQMWSKDRASCSGLNVTGHIFLCIAGVRALVLIFPAAPTRCRPLSIDFLLVSYQPRLPLLVERRELLRDGERF